MLNCCYLGVHYAKYAVLCYAIQEQILKKGIHGLPNSKNTRSFCSYLHTSERPSLSHTHYSPPDWPLIVYQSALAWQVSRVATSPLPAWGQGGRHMACSGGGDLLYTAVCSRAIHGLLQLFKWWRDQSTLVLTKEYS